MIKKLLFLVTFLLVVASINAQVCENIDAGDDVQMLCTDTDVQLDVTVLAPNYKTTRDYQVSNEPLCPAVSYDGSRTFIQTDDEWSDFVIDIPFTFCFYENQYDQLLISGNGIVTFDLTVIDSFSNWNTDAADLLGTNGQQNWQTNAIFGAYHDMNSNIQPREDRISYKTLGEAPNRRFIISFECFQFSCTTLLSRSQITLYESSNVIDVRIDEKPVCAGWNEGLAVVGIQNRSGTLSQTGREHGVWTPPAGGELWRFVPNGQDLDYTLIWYDESGTILNSNNDESITVNPQVETTYTVELELENQCNDTTRILMDTVTVTPGFSPDLEIPVNLVECEDPAGSGTADFNIDQTTFVLDGLDPADFLISYHNDPADAISGANPIGTLDPYNSSGETIFIRFEDVNDSTCVTNRSFTLTVTTEDDSSFDYANTVYCVNDPNPSADNIATAGGTFTIDNGGVIDPATGEIDLMASGTGMYTITYTTTGSCASSSTFDVDIQDQSDATFVFPMSVCISDPNPTPTSITTAGGTFSVDNGATIDGTTGELDLTSTTVGTTYTITYEFGGNCASSSTQMVSVVDNDDSSFSYPAAQYCNDDTNPSPTAVTAGGTYTISNGGAIDAGTGEVDLASSGLGTDSTGNFTITYTTAGTCSTSSTFDITIEITNDASFVYPVNVCIVDANPAPTSITTAGGTFTVDNGATIDAATGELDLSSTTAGTSYTITYTFGGNCPSDSTQTINVVANDDSSFTYPLAQYCSDGANPTPTAVTAGGTYTINNGGSIDSASGEVNLAVSGLGTDNTGNFTITYTTAGACSTSSTFDITVSTITVDDPSDVVACDSYTLPALSSGNYYTASNGGGTQLNAGDTITSTQTIYVYGDTGTTPNCTDENAFDVTINVTPTPDAPADVTACDSYTLPALSSGNYYTASNGGGTQLSAGSTITSSQTLYVYAETGTSPNCFAENSFSVTINTITADMLSDVADCDSYALPPLSANNNYYTASNGGGTQLNAGDLVTSTQTIYIYAESGTTPNCTDETSFTFTLYATPVASSPSTVLESCNNGDGTANFDIASIENEINTTDTITYHPTITDANNDTNAMSTNPLVAAGNVWARVENGDGCFTVVEVALTVETCFLIFPDAFAPTSPIVENRTFNIDLLRENYPNFEMYIYNRYGAEVYFANASKPDWNGKVDNTGDDLPVGTYFYGIKLNDAEQIRHRGWVYLQR